MRREFPLLVLAADEPRGPLVHWFEVPHLSGEAPVFRSLIAGRREPPRVLNRPGRGGAQTRYNPLKSVAISGGKVLGNLVI